MNHLKSIWLIVWYVNIAVLGSNGGTQQYTGEHGRTGKHTVPQVMAFVFK